jgi:hypothetical protein
VDNAQLSVAVWRPPDQWQAEDEAVELRMKHYAHRNRVLLYSIGVPVVVVLFEWLTGTPYTVAAAALLAVVATTIAAVWHQVVVGGWLPAAKELLAGSPSRRLAARVMAHRPGRTVIGTGEGFLLVRLANRGLRQVIARTGEITLVGPDADGRAVVFVDGHPTPLPAKVVAAAEQTEPEPVVDAPTWFVTRQARDRWILFAGALLVAAGFAYDAQQPMVVLVRPEIVGTAQFNWIYVALFVGTALTAMISALALHWLSRLLVAGQWQQYPAALVGWRGTSQRPSGDLTLYVSLPDGRSQKVVVLRASTELMANVYVTGTLWVVGPPSAGKVSAVGVPGHPIVAAARFE